MGRSSGKQQVKSQEIDKDIASSNRYPLIPLQNIKIVERPKPGDEVRQVFYNPRSLESFDSDKMDKLLHSIQTEGIQQPPQVRLKEVDDGVIQAELIAGERRLRCCQKIYEENLPCYDEDAKRPNAFHTGEIVIVKGRLGKVLFHTGDSVQIAFDDSHGKCEKTVVSDQVSPTSPGSKVYASLACKVIHNCSDERALRLAWVENKLGEPVPINDEIMLVERLEKMGWKQAQIAEELQSNVTWVSQTASFRAQLPNEAFQKLLDGDMARHVAVGLLAYAQDVREKLYEEMVVQEEKSYVEKVKKHSKDADWYDDTEDLQLAELQAAKESGDAAAIKKAERKLLSAMKKKKEAEDRLNRTKQEKGKITQGHAKAAAQATGLKPRKSKILEPDQIRSVFINGIAPYIGNGCSDPVTGEEIAVDLAEIVKRTAEAILMGVTDPLVPIRDYMVATGEWADPQTLQGFSKKKKSKNEDLDDDFEDDDFDEDDDELDPSLIDEYADDPDYDDDLPPEFARRGFGDEDSRY